MPVNIKCHAPQVHLLGEIVLAFGNLELFLEITIWQLFGDEEQNRNLMSQVVTAEMSFDRKVHAFVNMFKQLYPGQAESELDSLKKELFAVQGERNALMHSAWNYSEKYGGLFRMKASAKAASGFKRRIYPMQIERIETIRSRIEMAAESIARFTMEHIQEQGNE